MALSFGESIKKTQMKSSVAAAPTNLSTFSTDDVQPIVMEQEDVSFVRNNNYVWYNNYTDEKLSYIDEGKNISVDSSQINISQEENSQFIPFEMNRFYDGIDLKDMLIQIHYINQNNEEDFDNVVNCEYSKDKIRFAWLIVVLHIYQVKSHLKSVPQVQMRWVIIIAGFLNQMAS